MTALLSEHLESWNQTVFVETQRTNHWVHKTIADESSALCAIIITVTTQHSDKAQREFNTACLWVVVGGKACLCVYFRVSVMKLYLVTWPLCQDGYTHLCWRDWVWEATHLFSIWFNESVSAKVLSLILRFYNRTNLHPPIIILLWLQGQWGQWKQPCSMTPEKKKTHIMLV